MTAGLQELMMDEAATSSLVPDPSDPSRSKLAGKEFPSMPKSKELPPLEETSQGSGTSFALGSPSRGRKKEVLTLGT